MPSLRKIDLFRFLSGFDRRWLWVIATSSLVCGGIVAEGFVRGEPAIGAIVATVTAMLFVTALSVFLRTQPDPGQVDSRPE